MSSLITEFRFVGFGTTRDQCIQALDDLALVVLDKVGGAPWVMTDDDIKRISAESTQTLGDADGMCYIGIRTYNYRGPIVSIPSQTYHDGFKVQNDNEQS